LKYKHVIEVETIGDAWPKCFVAVGNINMPKSNNVSVITQRNKTLYLSNSLCLLLVCICCCYV